MNMGLKAKIKKLFPKPVNTPIVTMPSNGEELKDKVALISGGSGGIGLEIAKTFLKSGAKVIISGTNQGKLDKICSELNNENLKSMF
jgi:3-oxoacyl-[acyl-carrier protein] reductase